MVRVHGPTEWWSITGWHRLPVMDPGKGSMMVLDDEYIWTLLTKAVFPKLAIPNRTVCHSLFRMMVDCSFFDHGFDPRVPSWNLGKALVLPTRASIHARESTPFFGIPTDEGKHALTAGISSRFFCMCLDNYMCVYTICWCKTRSFWCQATSATDDMQEFIS